MLALRKPSAAPGVCLSETAEPEPGPGEVLIAVAAAGVCGSDLHIQAWSPAYAFMTSALPVTLGHEFAGTVAKLGAGVEELRQGARVVVMPSVTCGDCAPCRRGDPDACAARRGLGMTLDGAFAPHVVVPARNCLPIPDGLPFHLAALTEPLTVSAEAVARAEVTPASRVLVLGPGTIGQGIALLARHAGAAGIVIAGRDDRARFETLRALGFDLLVDVAEPDAQARLRQLAGEGFDAVIEATGHAAAIEAGLALLRTGGTLVIAGIHDEPARVDATAMVRRNLQIRGSFRSPRAVWPRIVAMLAADPELFAPMITHRMSLADAPLAFARAAERSASKIIVEPADAARTGGIL